MNLSHILYAFAMERISSERNSRHHSHSSRSRVRQRSNRRCTRHSDVKIAKRSTSPQRVAEPIKNLVKEPIRKKIEEKPREDKKKAESYNELSPLMTSMVEDELKDLMINVWQALLEDVSNEDEKPVLDKFMGIAVDDVRNTIGLNVTKRLLNVNSGILVKVVVHGPVARADLESFADDYGIAELKHVAGRIYAGRITTWPELDYLFKNCDLRCGVHRVSVSPVYHFMNCPSSLRTIFDGTRDYSKHKEVEIDTARNMKRQKSGKVIETADKVLAQASKDAAAKEAKKDAKDINKPRELKDVDKKKESVDKSKTTADTKKTSTVKVTDKKPVNKPQANHVASKDVTPKKELAKTVANKPSTTNTAKTEVKTPKTNEVKKPATTKVELTKVDTKSQTAVSAKKETINANEVKKPVTNTKVEQKPDNKPSQTATAIKKPVAKVEPTKIVTTKAAENKQSTPNSTPKKTVDKPNEVKKPPVNATKVEPTKTVTKPAEAKPNIPKIEVQKTNETTNKAEPKVVAKSNVTSDTPKKEAAKPNEVKKVEITAKSVLEKADNAKAVAAKTAPLKTAPPKTTPTKAAIAAPLKTVPAKTTPAKTVPAKAVPAKTVPAKTVLEKTVSTKTTPAKTVSAKSVAAKSPAKKTSKVEKKAPKENDFDELDDHDILIMLSSGIVLDECSGSDDD